MKKGVRTSVIEPIMAANIVGVMIAGWEIWASVSKYMERILRLRKRDIEATAHVGLPA